MVPIATVAKMWVFRLSSWRNAWTNPRIISCKIVRMFFFCRIPERILISDEITIKFSEASQDEYLGEPQKELAEKYLNQFNERFHKIILEDLSRKPWKNFWRDFSRNILVVSQEQFLKEIL